MKKGCLISLIVGGVLLAGFIGIFAYAVISYKKDHPELVAAMDARLQAEQKTMSLDGSPALGNNDRARQLAKQFSTTMKAMRQAFFTGSDDSKLSLSKGEFITFCQLVPGKCAFIVHVPQLRNYSREAQGHLAEMAWQIASVAVKNEQPAVKELAVGLRGSLVYGQIFVGAPDNSGNKESGVKVRGTNDDVLDPFFLVPPTPAAPAAK